MVNKIPTPEECEITFNPKSLGLPKGEDVDLEHLTWSPNGKNFMYQSKTKGSDWETFYFYDVIANKSLPEETVKNIKFGQVTWVDD